MEIKGLRLHEKKTFKRFQIKLLTDLIFAILHQMDIRIKKELINYDRSKKPAIYAMWHATQWGLGLFDPEERKDINILVSPSNDGELIARICHLLGFSLIRGSHKREGEKATREMIAATEAGQSIAFMVDGPKGPKQKVKKGIIRLAKMAKVPIIPIVPYTAKKKCFNSWDNYQVPTDLWLKGVMAFGEPIYVPADADEAKEEECRLQLEQVLFELEKDAIIEFKHRWGN